MKTSIKGIKIVLGLVAAGLAVAGTVYKAQVAVMPPSLQTPNKNIVWRDFLGANAHLLWFSSAQQDQQLAAWQTLGLGWVRVDLHWDRHETTANQFNYDPITTTAGLLQKRGMPSLMYLVGSAPFISSAPAGVSNSDQYPPRDNAVYADRLVKLAKRYPQVQAWQVWNEPNLPAFWQSKEDAAGYGRLLESSVKAMQAYDPKKTVVMAGMAYYSQMPNYNKDLMLEKLGASGAFKLGAVVAYHPYSDFPEGDVQSDRDFEVRSKIVNSRLREAGVKQIWATEWGWSSYAGPKEAQPLIGDQGQADFLLKRLALMSCADFDRIFLFALSDLDTRAGVRDRSYGLLKLDGSPKPAYLALQRFLKLTGPTVGPAALSAPVKAPAGWTNVTYARPDGHKVVVFWAQDPGVAQWKSTNTVKVVDLLTGQSQTISPVQGVLNVPVKRTVQAVDLG